MWGYACLAAVPHHGGRGRRVLPAAAGLFGLPHGHARAFPLGAVLDVRAHVPGRQPVGRRDGAAGHARPVPAAGAAVREVALPGAGGLLIAGGLTSQGTSTDAVTSLVPATGVTRAAGHLPAATHDAASATLGGQTYVFGGGTVASVPTVQDFGVGASAKGAVVGKRRAARSDASGVISNQLLAANFRVTSDLVTQ